MRYSANLNIMIKAIEKASFKTARDFSELEVLQSNPKSAIKFANACYNRLKQALIEDLTKMRPDYNLIFSDGQEIMNNEDAEYSFVIYPVDGLNNLSRALGECSIAISLEHKNEKGERNSVSAATYKIIGGDLFYAEKGFGAFLNNKRIKTSRRKSDDALLGCFDNSAHFEKLKKDADLKRIMSRNFGCKTLEICYLSSGKVDLCAFSKNNFQFLEPFLIILEEAGGRAMQDGDLVVLSNGNL